MNQNNTVILTGANNGIGFYMTRTLLEDGYRVAGLDLQTDNLVALQAAYPDSLRTYVCDVTDEVRVIETIEAIAAEWGRIDILVNNACLAVFSPFEEKDQADVRREFEVNYFGYLHLIRAVLPPMKAQGAGLIHNLSSSVGISGFPGIYGYASTKGAIEALTRTLAMEFAPYGITVNLVHPPLTNTQSASPLGVPVQAMDFPEAVGRKLARKIRSTKSIVTPDFKTAAGLWASRHFPEAIGRMMAMMTERAKEQSAAEAAGVGVE